MDINVDKEGFLRDLSDWDESVACELAALEDIELSATHWDIIKIVRQYYQQYGLSPVNRVFAKIIAQELGKDKGKSIYLMQLFSAKPAKIACKIAGLPKPPNCD